MKTTTSILLALGLLGLSTARATAQNVIRVKGSDTMVQLASAWAEAYHKVKPGLNVDANGGGTGTGFAALQNDTCDICDASREVKKEETQKTKSVTGKDVKEFVVAYDALAVYTNPSNPIQQISVEELRE